MRQLRSQALESTRLDVSPGLTNCELWDGGYVPAPHPNLSFPQMEKQHLIRGVRAPDWSSLTGGCFVYTLEDSPSVDIWCS